MLLVPPATDLSIDQLSAAAHMMNRYMRVSSSDIRKMDMSQLT
jgi:hypothetical protein